MLQQLLQDIQALGLLDWVVTITALIYVILSARNHPACWPFGIVSCALWAYASYFYYDLYADALLQIFYVLMGFVGLYAWLRGGQQAGEDSGVLPISRATPTQHLIYIGVGLVLGLLFGYLFSYTSADATYYDSLTTSFSVVATVLLVRRRLNNWLYWIVIDLAYAGLYYSQGAILFAALMLVYTVIAFFAYRHWVFIIKNQSK